jgi:hypothetical protein
MSKYFKLFDGLIPARWSLRRFQVFCLQNNPESSPEKELDECTFSNFKKTKISSDDDDDGEEKGRRMGKKAKRVPRLAHT